LLALANVGGDIAEEAIGILKDDKDDFTLKLYAAKAMGVFLAKKTKAIKQVCGKCIVSDWRLNGQNLEDVLFKETINQDVYKRAQQIEVFLNLYPRISYFYQYLQDDFPLVVARAISVVADIRDDLNTNEQKALDKIIIKNILEKNAEL